MKLSSTAALLIITLAAVPVFSIFFGTALGDDEQAALHLLIKVAAFAAAYCFVVSQLANNYSQVDKLWSILPIAYTWLVADFGNYAPRLVVMATLATLWGVRLTANFALKGAYTFKFWDGVEDYRWVVLRNKPEFKPRWKWVLFNLLFISGYQNALILLFTLPTIVALQYAHVPLGPFDYTVAGLMFFFIAFEAVADWQQWQFQSAKHKALKQGKPLQAELAQGFLSSGLWQLSRHPNYFAEQAIWLCFYFFSVAASGQWFNWSIAGCLLLIALFQGSANFSESLSAAKYPQYIDYQKRVPKFLPLGKKL